MASHCSEKAVHSLWRHPPGPTPAASPSLLFVVWFVLFCPCFETCHICLQVRAFAFVFSLLGTSLPASLWAFLPSFGCQLRCHFFTRPLFGHLVLTLPLWAVTLFSKSLITVQHVFSLSSSVHPLIHRSALAPRIVWLCEHLGHFCA